MSWFKDFSLDWFGKKKIQRLTETVEKLVKAIEGENSDKPYRNAYYSNGILTVVLKNGNIVSKVCSVADAKLLNTMTTEQQIVDFYSEKPMIAAPPTVIDKAIPTIELDAHQKFVEHADELLELLGDKFETDGQQFYYKGIPLAIPAILLNALAETKRQGLDEQFESFKNFWLWTSTNPVESSRNDLFTFIRENDVKLTPKGLLVLYRRIVSLDNKKDSKTEALEKFVSSQYFAAKKSKKSPRNYIVLQDTDGSYKRGSVDGKYDIPSLGNLADLYANLSEIEDNVYTDRHTRKKKIQIGTVYKEDEDKIDLDNSVDCSRGLHVASKSYDYGSFGDVPVLCLVNPAKVRAVPTYSTGKMRVSEMFIASVLEVDSAGRYMDDDLDVVPFDEEYCNISVEELEEASKNGLHLLASKESEVAVDKQTLNLVIGDIKSQIKNRVTTLA